MSKRLKWLSITILKTALLLLMIFLKQSTGDPKELSLQLGIKRVDHHMHTQQSIQSPDKNTVYKPVC